MLAFDITQFFPSLNHHLMLLILRKAECDMKISLFFSDYLVDRKTCYSWNGFTLSFFSADIGVGQGSALSSILSTLFIAPIFYVFEKTIKNLNIPVSFVLFVDDGLFISQEKSFTNTNANLLCSYNVMFSLLDQFGLIVEHRKTEIFHFSGHMIYSILQHWTLVKKIHSSILGSFLIENPCFNNISISM